jgi:hypothetical protein
MFGGTLVHYQNKNGQYLAPDSTATPLSIHWLVREGDQQQFLHKQFLTEICRSFHVHKKLVKNVKFIAKFLMQFLGTWNLSETLNVSFLIHLRFQNMFTFLHSSFHLQRELRRFQRWHQVW